MNGPKEILSHASHEAAHVKMTSRSIVTLILAIDNDIGRLIRLSTFSELNMLRKMGTKLEINKCKFDVNPLNYDRIR